MSALKWFVLFILLPVVALTVIFSWVIVVVARVLAVLS